MKPHIQSGDVCDQACLSFFFSVCDSEHVQFTSATFQSEFNLKIKVGVDKSSETFTLLLL